MGWSGSSHVHRYLRVAKQAPESLKRALQARQATMAIASRFLDNAKALPAEKHEEVLAHAAEQRMSAAEFGRYLKRLLGGPRPKAEAKPIRALKGGGFVLAQLRCEETHAERLDQQIELLRDALKRARALKKKAEKNAGRSEEEGR